MADVVPVSEVASRITSVGTTTGRGIFSLLSYGIFSIFLFIFILHAVVVGVEQHSLWAGISDIGGRFLLATEKLSVESQKILTYGGIYDGSRGILIGAWNSFLLCFGLIEASYVIFLWIKVLYKLMPYLPISGDKSKVLVNLLLAISFFTVTQMLIISVHAGVAGQMTNTETAVKIIMKPVTCYIDFIKAIPMLIKPMSESADTIYNRINNITITGNPPIPRWGNQTIVEVPAPKVT
jgi:hypothetical protein